MTRLVWLHAAFIALVGPLFHYRWEWTFGAVFETDTVLYTLSRGAIIALFAIIADRTRFSHAWRATAVAFGLMTSSAVLVILSEGYIEAHFHFFVMIAFLALYQDWIPYLLAILFVTINHGVVGVLRPHEVFDHPAAINAPWTWAGIHAFFLLWAAVGSVIAWKYNEQAFDRIRLILESAAEGIFGVDRAGKITFVNAAAIRMLRQNGENFAGKPLERLLLQVKIDKTGYQTKESQIFMPFINKAVCLAVDELFERRDGTRMAVDYRSSPIFEKREVIGVVVTFNDITERKQAKDEEQKSQEQIRLLLDSTAEAIYGVDLQGRCTFSNQACLHLLGYATFDALAGRNMHTLIHHSRPDGTPYPREESKIYKAFISGRGAHAKDEALWRADGTFFHAEYWSHPVYRNGIVIGSVVTFLDITERRQAEKKLQESEECFRQLAENIDQVFFLTNHDATSMIYISPIYKKIWGRSCKSLYDDPASWMESIHPEDRPGVEKLLREDVEHFHPEYRIVRPDGAVRWIWARIFLIRDEKGAVYRLAGIAEDITERKLAAETLREAKEFSDTLIQTANVIILGLDSKGKINIFNQTAEKITGYTLEELKGKDWFEIFTPKDRFPHVWEEFNRLLVGGLPKTFENPILTKAGEERYIMWQNNQVRIKGEIVATISFGNDITERKEAERILKERKRIIGESEAKYRAITESTQDAIISIDADGKIFFWNTGAEMTFGYTEEEIMDKSLFLIIPERLNEDHATGLKSYMERVKVDVIGISEEFTGLTKLGEALPLDLTLSPWTRDGKVFFTCVIRDYSHRKTMEKEKGELEIQLRSAQKLEAIGQLAAGISHEINTPMQYIGDNTKFLQDSFGQVIAYSRKSRALVGAAKEHPLLEEVIKDLETTYQKSDLDYLFEEIPNAISQSLEGIQRVSEIVKAMKEFAHPGGQEKTPFDLNHAIETTVIVARNEWKYAADMETDFDPKLPLIDCLPGEMNQVFLNLIVNAAHAIQEKKNGGEKGKIVIQTRKDDKGWAEIRIRDTGMGIPEKVRDRIFDPFFTTKAVGKGSGQGLAIARSVIVDKHQGNITFESTIGIGTTFIIRLPLSTTD